MIDTPRLLRDLWKGSRLAPPSVYWESWKAPHRIPLVSVVQKLSPKSLFEIGCASGPNLRLLRAECPSVKLGGSDINPDHAEWARGQGLDVTEQELPHDVTGWDCALSCYTLAYLEHPAVVDTLRRLPDTVILMEPWGYTPNASGLMRFVAADGNEACPRYYHWWPGLLQIAGYRIVTGFNIPDADDLRVLVIAQRAPMLTLA